MGYGAHWQFAHTRVHGAFHHRHEPAVERPASSLPSAGATLQEHHGHQRCCEEGACERRGNHRGLLHSRNLHHGDELRGVQTGLAVRRAGLT
jgi:hypothetical protein